MGCEQAGFRKKSGTREAIFCLKVITEKYLEMRKELYACFIDYSKAFGTVNHDTVLIAEDEASLQDLVTAVKDESEKCGLLMNIKKTKVILLTKDTKEKKVSIHSIKKLSRSNHLPTLVSLSQMMVKAKEKSEVELALLKMHSQRDINF